MYSYFNLIETIGWTRCNSDRDQCSFEVWDSLKLKSLKNNLFLQIQNIKQNNSALREKLDTGVDEFRPTEVIFSSLELHSSTLISYRAIFFFYILFTKG